MPETTVAAIVTSNQRKEGEILLTRRRIPPFQGQWCLPGGHIDRYESAQDAIIREVMEETGLEYNATFLGYFDEVMAGHGIHAVVLVFTGPGSGELIGENDEVSDIGWFSLDEASALPLAFKHNEVLTAYAAERGGGSIHDASQDMD